jgi:hypothetical protein
MKAARSLDHQTPPSPKSVDELLAVRSDEAGVMPRVDEQVSLRNMNTISPPTIYETWPLTPEEVALLTVGGPQLAIAGEVTAGLMRSSHHAMARDLANGVRMVDVSRLYGLPMATLETLLQAPAFVELMESYRGETELVFDMDTKMQALAHDALDEIRTRLETKPEKFATGQLMDLSGDMLDRTGHSKVSRSVQLQGGLGGQDLERIKEAEPQLLGSKASGSKVSDSAAD